MKPRAVGKTKHKQKDFSDKQPADKWAMLGKAATAIGIITFLTGVSSLTQFFTKEEQSSRRLRESIFSPRELDNLTVIEKSLGEFFDKENIHTIFHPDPTIRIVFNYPETFSAVRRHDLEENAKVRSENTMDTLRGNTEQIILRSIAHRDIKLVLDKADADAIFEINLVATLNIKNEHSVAIVGDPVFAGSTVLQFRMRVANTEGVVLWSEVFTTEDEI